MTSRPVVIILLVIATSHTDFALERGASCRTPNGEEAKCIPVGSCAPFVQGIATQNKTVIEYAKASQCGYDQTPLVCCGSSNAQTTPSLSNIFTKAPSPPPTTSVAVQTGQSGHAEPPSRLPDRSVCGLERDYDRIIGGTVTSIAEFPWMALLRYSTNRGEDLGFKCGGTIINSRYVLTAAHCIRTTAQNINVTSVRLGEWKISTDPDCIQDEANVDCADSFKDVAVEDVIAHSYYSSISGNNDIALIRLAESIQYTDFIRPICLPPAEAPAPPEGTIMSVCGWGTTENDTTSDVKLKVELPLVSNKECARKLNTKRTRISANQVCAGGETGKDSCQGDSGGPLMRQYGDYFAAQIQWYQEGVVSRGRGCGRPGLPGIYTRVARYINWLLNNIRD